MAEFSDPFADFDEPEPAAEDASEPKAEPVIDSEAAAESERRLAAAADEYVDLLPEIEAAQPVRGTVEVPKPLTGVDYALDAWTRLVGDRATSVEWGLNSAGTDFRSRAVAVGSTVILEVECEHPAARELLAERLIEMADRRGNLGRYAYIPGSAPGRFNLIREGVEDPTFGWREQSKTYTFYRGGYYRRGVLDLAGLVQKTDRGLRQYPQCEFGADDRGGIAVLTLPPGMLPKQVVVAESALRQALAMPELTVTVDGIHPVIHLNQRPIVREFPKVNPLKAQWFTRPRTQAERHAAAPDFVLPLGVRQDGTPILVNQAVAPHMGIFGGTGAGKTVLLTQLVKAAVMQGAEVVMVDAKNGKDLRRIALQNLPGVVHYSSGSEAGLHRAVSYVRDEFERRKALAARLQHNGIEYQPTPILLVFDEAPAWLDDAISGPDKETKKAAEATVANLAWIASQAREQKCFLLTAGQYAYASAFAGRWKSNTQTLVILGPPSEINRLSLFPAGEPRERVKELGNTITKAMKGRGIVADTETGEIGLFQGFLNTGRDAEAFDAALQTAPRLRRFAWKFPLPGEPGGDGSWQDWTPVSDPPSDSLPVQILDGPDGVRDPGAVIFDPTSEFYKPGSKPLSATHHHVNSYDR